ncbi:MAG: sulfur oxidation c-type cytochrome SoxX [Kiloniellaceae bacterium]
MFAARISLAAAAFVAGISAAAAMDMAPDDVTVVDGVVAKSLTGAPGDVADGRKFFADRKLGNCLACHANSDMSEQLFHGEVGPPLDGVGERWSEEELRAIIVNSKAVFGEQTVMPGFYTLDVGKNVRKDLVGKTILTAEQVESIVAYLVTLK